MGVTQHSIDIIERHLPGVKSVIELGDQINYSIPKPWEYMSEWYGRKGIDYHSIDLNGRNNSWAFDWSELLQEFILPPADLVTNFGSSEHTCNPGEFDWERIYNCHLNMHNLCRTGGVIICENPKTGNWPGHGGVYYTGKFYQQLWEGHPKTDQGIKLKFPAVYDLLELGEHPACGNTTDGWNVYAVLRKIGNPFPTLEHFKTFALYES